MWPSKVIGWPERKYKSQTVMSAIIMSIMSANRSESFIPKLYITILICFLLGIFFYRHPSAHAYISRQHRRAVFEEFKSEIVTNKSIPYEKYWKFRERFSPGSFVINYHRVNFFQTFRIISIDGELSNLLYYTSPHLLSVDSITLQKTALTDVVNRTCPCESILQTESFALLELNNTTYVLAFMAPISEMQKVNGMFDYLPEEQKLLEGTSWLNITELTL